MRARFGISVLAIAALVLVAWTGTVSATVTFSDDFTGTVLDPAKWSTAGTVPTVVDPPSDVQLWSIHSTHDSEMTSLSGFGPGNVISWTVGANDLNRGAGGFGVDNPGTTDAIVLRCDMWPGTTGYPGPGIPKVWQVYVAQGTNTAFISLGDQLPLANDVYDIVWKSDLVQVLRNGTPVGSENTVIPTATNLNLHAFYYSSTNQTYFNFGSVSVSTIPEPGTVVLLATGLLGLMAYAWRKRK